MLDGKVAVVTGGTRGIGFATVEKFLENGAKVVLLGSKKESVDKAINKLNWSDVSFSHIIIKYYLIKYIIVLVHQKIIYMP